LDQNIWINQLEFNEQFFRDMGFDISKLSLKDKIHWSKEFYFHINKELVDLIESLPNWKMHYQNNEKEDEIITSNLIEEYVDVLKYFMGLGQLLGISYTDIVKGYYDKTEVVKQKYEQNKKFQALVNKPVVIFDIDGVINNFPVCFLEWANKQNNSNFESIEEMKDCLDLKTYRNLKTGYRLSGEKRKQPVNHDTIKLMNTLKDNNETIILFTNRPVTKYKVIYTDTIFWLKDNKIPFDAIYWSDLQKKEDIYKLKFKIKFIVEDDINNAKNFNHEGHLVFLLNKTYNQDYLYENSKLKRIDSPLIILDYL